MYTIVEVDAGDWTYFTVHKHGREHFGLGFFSAEAAIEEIATIDRAEADRLGAELDAARLGERYVY